MGFKPSSGDVHGDDARCLPSDACCSRARAVRWMGRLDLRTDPIARSADQRLLIHLVGGVSQLGSHGRWFCLWMGREHLRQGNGSLPAQGGDLGGGRWFPLRRAACGWIHPCVGRQQLRSVQCSRVSGAGATDCRGWESHGRARSQRSGDLLGQQFRSAVQCPGGSGSRRIRRCWLRLLDGCLGGRSPASMPRRMWPKWAPS